MEIHDITREIHEGMVIYPKNPEVSFERTQEASQNTNSLTRMELGTHTGTHIDTPRHIHVDGDGALTYPLSSMTGSACVLDLTSVDSVISASDLPETSCERVLLKTKNSLASPDEFDDDFVALDESAAEELVARGVRLIGLDALSIKKRGVKDRVHEILIDSGMVVLEGIWLEDVEAGDYELICLPMKVDTDGAPARVILRK